MTAVAVHQKCLFLLLATSLFLPQAALAQNTKKVAVLGLELTSLNADAAKTASAAGEATTALRKTVAETPGYTIAPNSNQDLAEAKLLSGCTDEAPACMANIGTELGADLLLYGHFSKASSGYQIEVIFFDIAKRKVIKTAAETVPTNDASAKRYSPHTKKLFATVADIASPVVAPPPVTKPKPQSKLTVQVIEPALTGNVGTVIVDGTPVGNLVNGSFESTTISPGEHAVKIAVPGYEPTEQKVVLRDRIATTLDFRLVTPNVLVQPEATLKKKGGSNTDKIIFWSAATVTVAAGGLWAFSGLKVKEAEDEKDDFLDRVLNNSAENMLYDQALLDGSRDDGCDAAEAANLGGATPNLAGVVSSCADGRKFEKIANVAIATTAVVGAVAAFYAYRAFFRNSESEPEPGPSVQLVPVLSPNQAGAELTIRF